MLVDEVEARTRVRWGASTTWPADPAAGVDRPDARPLIAIASIATLDRSPLPTEWRPSARPPGHPEAYCITTARAGGRDVVWILGADDRGILFGVGKLLRALHMERDRSTLPEPLACAAAPRYALRGHQLGYRAKTNSYDAWTVPMWEQYIRDLAVFGANAIELIPPRSDDDPDSPHFPLPPLAMMTEMSRIAAELGLEVWIWFPALEEDYTDPATMDRALREWAGVFQALPRVDAVFVPGGDPGATPPKPLFKLLEAQAANLKKFHPRAAMWFSPQGFHQVFFDEIVELVRQQPAWLAGLVFGPQVRMNLPELRAAVPASLPIRFYPDITHSRTCQYPVPDWDRVFALTEGREVINPRPLDQAAIFRRYSPATIGFITYSEGCNDDVNKAIWSMLGWDPDAPVIEILRDYARYFIDPGLADPFAQGLLALERNWRGAIAVNSGIETTLMQFEAMERAAGPRVRLNWRFQQALYRACYDALLRRRFLHQSSLEIAAHETLARAPQIGAGAAMDQAEGILARADFEPIAAGLRSRTGELAEALFQSIRMQLDVQRYAGQLGRGTSQETIDRPLNDRAWLLREFDGIRKLASEPDRLARIHTILHRTDPGPGGFYDDLGKPGRQPHVVPGLPFEADPAARASVLTHFDGELEMPASWYDQCLTLYEQPLRMKYEGLDPAARYRLRVVYSLGPVTLATGEGIPIHPAIDDRYQPLEFEIPPGATAAGTLELVFRGQPGRGGNGRSCGICEVWLIRASR
jgi:hypothetical protein